MRIFATVLVIGTCLAAATARAAHTEVQLLLSADTAQPGDTVLAGVQLKMRPGWHTYWKNPGDAGQATEIKWQLPPGITAGEIEWPLPQKLPPAEVTTYGYEEEVVLLVPLKLEKNLPSGTLNLAAKVSWLECKDACIPASDEVQGTLRIGTATKPATTAALIASWQTRVPKPATHFTAQALWQKPATDNTRTLLIEVDWPMPGATAKHENVDFFPAASDDFQVQAETKTIEDSVGELVLSRS